MRANEERKVCRKRERAKFAQIVDRKKGREFCCCIEEAANIMTWFAWPSKHWKFACQVYEDGLVVAVAAVADQYMA